MKGVNVRSHEGDVTDEDGRVHGLNENRGETSDVGDEE